MKELKFRYTNHEWYSLVRSFLIMIGIVLIVSVIDFILLALPIDWQTTFGTVVRSIGLAVGAVAGVYLGFIISCKVFDKEGIAILNDGEIVLKLGKKEQRFFIKDIEEVCKDTFAKYDGLRFKDTKTIGPLYSKHSIVTARGEFSIMASIEEGWKKAGMSVLGKENPVPIYSVDEAFEKLSRHVDMVKGREKAEEEEALEDQ